MPQLADDAPAGGMYRIGHEAPAVDLCRGPDAGVQG